MTPYDIEQFLKSMKRQKLKIGRSVHVIIEDEGEIQFSMCGIHELEPAQ